jgi:hypothetical protein
MHHTDQSFTDLQRNQRAENSADRRRHLQQHRQPDVGETAAEMNRRADHGVGNNANGARRYRHLGVDPEKEGEHRHKENASTQPQHTAEC